MSSPTASDSRVAREGGVSVTTSSWDPYEVWLTRVKLPRELLRRQGPPAMVASAVKPETGKGPSAEPSLA